MYELLESRLTSQGFTVIKNESEIRVYCDTSSMAVAVFNTIHGDLTYTIYFVKEVEYEKRKWLQMILSQCQHEFAK